MISPLHGGGRRRRLALGGPALGGRRSARRWRPRRMALLLGCWLTAIAGWLAFGASDVSDQGGTGALFAAAPRAPAAPPVQESSTVALDRPDSLRMQLEQRPKAGLLFDLDTGEVLWRHRPREQLPIASLTKLMTALLVIEDAKPARRVQVTREAIDFRGSAVGLPKGKRMRVESLLSATLVQSGNDAASALAIAVAGSEKRFVERMNRRAERLGLGCTRFVSPHGLEPRNRSCAADVAALTRLAMEKPRVRRIVRRDQAVVPAPIEGGKLHLATTNPLLKSGYPGTIGLKTGYTVRAGQCLVGVVRRGDRTLAVVLIDSRNTEQTARRLLDKGFGKRADR